MFLNYIPFLGVIILSVISSIAFSASDNRQSIDGLVYMQPQILVEIEPGRKLNLYCVGAGSPTVVFESGLATSIHSWGYVQPVIGQKTRACSYDRAGIGFSDPNQRPATSANIIDDLHRLLGKAKINPPYVLVGHSSGGLNVRLYAHNYPTEVVGMVLIDPSDESQLEATRRLDPKKRTRSQWYADNVEPDLQIRRECIVAADAGFILSSGAYKKCRSSQVPQLSKAVQEITDKNEMRPTFQRALLSEYENFYGKSSEQLHAARSSFGAMPLIILTESQSQPEGEMTSTQLAELNAYYILWVNLHKELAKLSTSGVSKIIPDSGHSIQLEQPQAVEAAIMKVLKMIDEEK